MSNETLEAGPGAVTPGPAVAPAISRTRTYNTWSCTVCGGRFSGLETCHCTLCHRTFAGPKGFDAHRPSYGGCLDLLKQQHAAGRWRGKPKWREVTRTVGGRGYEPFTYTVISEAVYVFGVDDD